jgi:hypothetical protein
MTIKGIHVVHTMPGRLRLRVDKVKGNPAFAQKAQDKLGRVPGINQVEAKPQTGSVLIYYDAAALLAEGALAALTDGFSELFPEAGAAAMNLGLGSLIGHLATGEKTRSSANLMKSLESINAEVARLTGGLDLKLLIPMTLLFFGVRSLWSSKKLAVPAWYDYLWFAFNSFALLNLRPTDVGEKESVQAEPEGMGTVSKTGKTKGEKGVGELLGGAQRPQSAAS